MVAVTRLKAGNVAVNPDFKLAGRSAYLCRIGKCMVRARDRKGRNGLEHALKTPIPAQIWEELGNIVKTSEI